MLNNNQKQDWISKFNHIVEKNTPDSLVFAVILTIIVFVLSQVSTDTSVDSALLAWGNGLKSLLAFSTQIAFIVVAAYVLAHTNTVHKLLVKIGSLPKTATQAYVLVTLSAGMLSLILWPLGTIAGGLIAREVGYTVARRGISVHYPLLVAAAFGGFIVWHMGYSSSIGLAVATAGNPLEQQIGGIIPVSETLLAWWNIATIIITLTVVCLTIILLQPKNPIGLTAPKQDPSNLSEVDEDIRPGLMGILENSRITSTALAFILFLFLGIHFRDNGLDLNLNIVNWSFLALGLLLVKSSKHYMQLFAQGGPAGIIVLLQYPLYGGMMGLMMSSGLTQQFSELIIQNSTAETLPYYGFFSAGLINMAIPSGGAQWALQGPIFVDAAQQLGVDIKIIAMSIAWGDQWSNIIQPFVAIPLLAVTGLKLRQIYSYCLVVFATTSLAFVLGLFLATTVS